jgi:crossover junction endodeoxyribonuclease RuvC
MPKKTATLLALDPGTRDLGYAVLRGKRLVTSGVVPLRLLPLERRFREARTLLEEWRRAYKPRLVVLEATHAQPGLTFHRVHVFSQAVTRWAQKRRIPVVRYAPQTVRAAVAGNGKARKRELARAVATRIPALRVYVTQDRKWKERYFQNMFDAVALALHHHQPPSRSRRCG